jgi:hypothetical protein
MRIKPAEFDAFLAKWRSAITFQSDLWEGPQAVGELRREAGYLDFILCKPAGRRPPVWMLQGILGEVADYRMQKQAWQQEFRDTEIFLAKIGRESELQSKKTATVHLKDILHKAALGIEEQRIAVKSYMDTGKKVSLPGGAWEKLWPHRARIEIINRGIALDTRLQLQCAKMLRTFLRAVSVRTIARLIVLVYRTTELAIVKNDALWIVSERRRISVRSVAEKLARNRFPKETREIP